MAAACDVRKLYMFNNMWGFANWEAFPGTKLALTMDERSWLRMIASKGAALYWDKPRDEYFSITRRALRESAHMRYVNTALSQAGSWCYTWQDIVTPTGLETLFTRLGLTVVEDNIEFMGSYLRQHDVDLLGRILGPRLSEIRSLL
jgi:hypothetical protein